MQQYLFILGQNSDLSLTELKNFSEQIFFDKKNKISIGQNLIFQNLRNLPKTKEQLFLDRLGGIIRFGEIIEKINISKQPQTINFLYEKISQYLQKYFFNQNEENSEQIKKIGFSAFGFEKNFLKDFIIFFKKNFEKKIRVENYNFQNMSSGQIFDRKLLKKGVEFIFFKKQNEYFIAKTVANQNIRNYVLRDRKKPFRDAKMGMLPPKLAQILINLANPKKEEIIIDPFCGSGTINSEAAIMGYRTIGSDKNENFLEGAKKNFEFLAEKFRFEKNTGKFFASDILDFDFKKIERVFVNYVEKLNQCSKFGTLERAEQVNSAINNYVIVTEGFLGKNFESTPSLSEINQESEKILDLWEKIFVKLKESKINKIIFCLPAWNIQDKKNFISKNSSDIYKKSSSKVFKKLENKKISISKKLFAKIKKNTYISQAFRLHENTFFYERPSSFVAREICTVSRVAQW